MPETNQSATRREEVFCVDTLPTMTNASTVTQRNITQNVGMIVDGILGTDRIVTLKRWGKKIK